MLSHRNCLLLAALSLARAAPVTISNTVPRRDTDGDIISAGDGCISYQPYEKTYYLFGAHYQPCEEPNNDCYSGAPGEGVCHNVGWVPEGTCCGWRNATIAAWSSPDLVTWRKEGLNVLPLATANPASPLSSNWGAIFEPCGVYNRLTDSWTLFFLRDGYTLASAVARTPAGPFSVLQWTVPVPGFKTIVDFYFWQDVASGRLLMKHNGGGGESVVVWDEFYFAINQSSAIFGKELGYTEGGGVFEHDGDTYVMAGYGCCCEWDRQRGLQNHPHRTLHVLACSHSTVPRSLPPRASPPHPLTPPHQFARLAATGFCGGLRTGRQGTTRCWATLSLETQTTRLSRMRSSFP